jgi:hypothetical protein
MTSRPSSAAPILAVLAVVLVTLGLYVGGYLAYCGVEQGKRYTVRRPRNHLRCCLFLPPLSSSYFETTF